MQKKSNGAGHDDNCKCSFCRQDLINKPLFPHWRRAVRNAVAVGIIAGVANFQNIYPPSLETFYSVATGFIIAFGIEFANAYKHWPEKQSSKAVNTTFFLS